MKDLWEFSVKDYIKEDNYKNGTLFNLANGYMGMRGYNEFSLYNNPGNYIAGIFDRSTAQVTELVNLPNPLLMNIYVNGQKIDLDINNVIDYQRSLDMGNGILKEAFIVEVQKGLRVQIESERFVSRKNFHRWACRYSVTALDSEAFFVFESIIDGGTVNSGHNPKELSAHYKVSSVQDLKPGVMMVAITNDKKIEIAQASCIILKEKKFSRLKFNDLQCRVQQAGDVIAAKGETIVVYKFGAVYSSRESSNASTDCKREIEAFIADGYEAELEKHSELWQGFWNSSDIKIQGNEEAQKALRFNIFHLSSCAYDKDPTVSIGAKGLHGEGYKGHVFWDTETFMLPFFIYTQPQVAKALLMYRYNTLDGARRNAFMNGFSGAQYAWESADDGLETTPKWGYDYNNKPVRIWTGDIEVHISSDIVFSIFEYYRATEDKDFMFKYGSEIIFEVCRFWTGRAVYNKNKDIWEINSVIGPDEFHEHVDNNFYTNYLVKWTFSKALELREKMKNEYPVELNRIENYLCLTEKDYAIWKNISDKILINKQKETDIIEQFEGYFDLKEYEITSVDENGMPQWPKGLNLSELNSTKLIKQPDVIMLMLMMPQEFSEQELKANYEYYEKRTMHKSSLSPSMYSIMGMKVGDTHNAFSYFMKCINTDIKDNQGNSLLGLHAASSAGAWQTAVYGFGGFSIDSQDRACFSPWLAPDLQSIEFSVVYKNSRIKVFYDHKKVVITSERDMQVKVYSEVILLKSGIECEVRINK